ncbi:MAG TPA: hypothetical protein VFX92_01420 [Candidatus Krumholzibacteria bacterium]|nr:hypothetical protein [Candidatus Krumholzibacteria bacterium]
MHTAGNRSGRNWRFTSVVLACVVGAGASFVPASRAADADDTATNLGVMTQLTNAVVLELYAGFAPLLGGRSVALKPLGNSEDYLFVSNVIVTQLTGAGVPTIRASSVAPAPPRTGNAAMDSLAGASQAIPSQTARGGVTLEFQNVAFQLGYPDVYRSHLVGGKVVRRHADVRVFATLTDAASGEVLWTGEAERSQRDEFDRDDTGRIEAGAYGFLRPPIPGGGVAKYAEPVFVTAVIVGLIYLFFANQSGN